MRIEKVLLESMSDSELKEWQLDIHPEIMDFVNGVKQIKEEYKFYTMSEMTWWFIYTIRYLYNGWEESERKQRLSKRIGYELRKRNPTDSPSGFKEVDINEVDIKDVISRYATIPSNYNRVLMKCPIHGEKTGSLKIYDDTNSYYCYGCKSGGGPVEFFCAMEGLEKKEGFKRFIQLYFN